MQVARNIMNKIEFIDLLSVPGLSYMSLYGVYLLIVNSEVCPFV